MKQTIILGIIILIGFQSCEKDDDNLNNDYSIKSEITLPTDSPRGLAFDGEYLWYSDDSNNSLNKISNNGTILKTIDLNNCKITGFEFSVVFINKRSGVNCPPVFSLSRL